MTCWLCHTCVPSWRSACWPAAESQVSCRRLRLSVHNRFIGHNTCQYSACHARVMCSTEYNSYILTFTFINNYKHSGHPSMVEQQIDEPINNVPFTLADFSADKSALTVAALSMSLFMSAIVGRRSLCRPRVLLSVWFVTLQISQPLSVFKSRLIFCAIRLLLNTDPTCRQRLWSYDRIAL